MRFDLIMTEGGDDSVRVSMTFTAVDLDTLAEKLMYFLAHAGFHYVNGVTISTNSGSTFGAKAEETL